MKTWLSGLAGVALGAVVATLVLSPWRDDSVGTETADTAAEPVYWVAPMDPTYRRDGPGKSPMGMDLVPVYADSDDAAASGSIRISPNVVNNLGVRTARVQRGPWRSEIRTVGYVAYDEDLLVHIHPRVSGWVETLYVKAAGDPVAPGQALYELYSPELVNAQEEFLLARKRQNTQLIAAAKARLRSLQLSDDFIESLSRSGEVRQTVTFRAGRGGVVDNLAIREGFYVEPGTTMMSIGSVEDVWVEAEIFARQSVQVKAGLEVTMTLDYLPGRTWYGEVDYVYPTLDPRLRTVIVRLRFANVDGLLKPNMFAQVVIHAESEGDVLSVPREALIRTGSENRLVMSLGAGRYRAVPVRPGRVGETRVEILSGVAAGDEIVTSAQFLLDSESSKAAGFTRMDDPQTDAAAMNPDGTGGDHSSHGGMKHDTGHAAPRQDADSGAHAHD